MRYILFVVIALFSNFLFAQINISNLEPKGTNKKAVDSSKEFVVDKLLKYSFFSPGIEYERKISDYSTVCIYPSIGVSFATYVSTYGSSFYYSILPNVEVQYRNYVNYKNRIAQGKNTKDNSANYIAFSTMAFTPPLASTYSSWYGITAGLKYGIQRTYKNGFFFKLDFGYGVMYSDYEVYVTPMSNYSIGLYVNKSK